MLTSFFKVLVFGNFNCRPAGIITAADHVKGINCFYTLFSAGRKVSPYPQGIQSYSEKSNFSEKPCQVKMASDAFFC